MQTDTSIEILSNVIHYLKYARYVPEHKRRETFTETVDRNMQMHCERFPDLADEIRYVYSFVHEKKVLPSMRSMQFAGDAIRSNNTRLYNCSYLPMNTLDAFHEVMFLLLSGTGVGISVQKHHVAQLPPVYGCQPIEDHRCRPHRHVVDDSIEGWADAIRVLIDAYCTGTRTIGFDYQKIRPKGALLKTSGGRAPGPQPLKDCVHNVAKVLDCAIEERGRGTTLEPVEVHDMVCHIANAVLAGGIRRAALISGFSLDDEKMLHAKSGPWWELHPQRGRANNSVVFNRRKIDRDSFLYVWEILRNGGSGEPGFYFTNDDEWFTNPCSEISLRPFQMCNLTEVNAATVTSQKDLNERVRAAAFIGTLQAAYTDFHYLRDIWKKTVEEDALLGVSLTGIASGRLDTLDIAAAAQHACDENENIAKRIGIHPAARITTIKPSGTSSLVLGTSSGIHAWHSPFYIRRIRIPKREPLYTFLRTHHPELVEDEFFNPVDQAVITVPVRAPENAVTRTESSLDLLRRVQYYFHNWIQQGYRYGVNQHNVSVTVSVGETEWEQVRDWMWANRESYNGISLLPYDDHTYRQAPFEECTEQQYKTMYSSLHAVDLTQIVEEEDNTTLQSESACGGGVCEV